MRFLCQDGEACCILINLTRKKTEAEIYTKKFLLPTNNISGTEIQWTLGGFLTEKNKYDKISQDEDFEEYLKMINDETKKRNRQKKKDEE